MDESGVNKDFQREYGRAARGEPVTGTQRGRSGKRTNVIGALCNKKHLAVQSYNHATNASFFEQWFKECLLDEVPKGCTVILDNARFHRKTRLREIAEKKHVNVLFLPAYSPDFNPIEQSWANMKKWLRSNGPFSSIDWAIYAYFIYSDSYIK